MNFFSRPLYPAIFYIVDKFKTTAPILNALRKYKKKTATEKN